MKPRFTDEHKYPNGYTPANKTDVSKTFKRIREQQAKNQAEIDAKVTPMKVRTAK